MFVLSITYTAPIEAVDALIPAHVAWLKQGHDAGAFLGWGAKVPRTGGVILAIGDRAAVQARAATDPFITGGVATVDVTEVAPSFLAPGLEGLAQ